MAAQHMAMDSFWVEKPRYDEAEQAYYERLGNVTLTPLADEVGRARQRLIEIRGNVEEEVAAIGSPRPPGTDAVDCKPDAQSAQKVAPIIETAAVIEEIKVVPKEVKENTEALQPPITTMDTGAIKFLEKKVQEFQTMLHKIESHLINCEARLTQLEKAQGVAPVCQKPPQTHAKKDEEDDDDVDLFGSESEDDETANKVKEERLAAYNAKKSKKPALIAKSSVILDIKPWDDETDMKAMEVEVRKIVMDGLLWGASKLVPLAYGIHKLQINCVVEDEKVSIDELQEKLEAVEDYIQSVDVAAFNKI